MKNPPYFPFYPKDWLTDEKVEAMSYHERGIYIDLLCKCWIEDGLMAENGSAIAKLFLRYENLQKCFIKKRGKWHNPKLDKLKREWQRTHKCKRDAGLRGAEARWRCHRSAINLPLAKNGSSSSSSYSYSYINPPYNPSLKKAKKIRLRLMKERAGDIEKAREAKDKHAYEAIMAEIDNQVAKEVNAKNDQKGNG